MPGPAPVNTWKTQVGIGKEGAGTWGTGVVPTDGLPVPRGVKPADVFADVVDDALRGIRAKTFEGYQDQGHGEFDTGDMNYYPGLSGHFLCALIGPDTMTGAGPYTHTFALGDVRSYSITDFQGLDAQARRWRGMYFSELTFKMAGTGRLSVTAKATGMVSEQVAKPVESYTLQAMLLPWQTTVTIAGVGTLKVVNFELSLKQAVELVPGFDGGLGPSQAGVDTLSVDGKMAFSAADETELQYYLANTKPAVVVNIASGTNSLAFTMSKTWFKSPTTVDRGSTYAKVDSTFEGIYNATDGGPIKVVEVSTRNAAY